MERLPMWVSAGLLSAGVSAAVLAGAGVALADDSTTGSGSESASDSSPAAGGNQPESPSDDTTPDTSPGAESEVEVPEKPSEDTLSDTPKKKKKNLTARTDAMTALRPRSAPMTASAPERTMTIPAETVVTTPTLSAPTVSTPAVTDIGAGGAAAVAKIAAQPSASLALAAPEAAAPVQAAAASPPNLIRWLQGVVGRITNGIGSLAFNSLQALEALVTGPPVLPPNSTVTVRNSTILLSTGQRVKANWYYPEGDVVPEKLIVLQHGFFALGPMYSFTAANLAASTGAIVVTPTISSNPFAGDDNWINGDGMAAAIAELFVGDRTALTDSALAAGFATRYGLDPADATLPEKFGLAGHSAGAGLMSAVAGYLVDNGAADDLVGVITLDGVPSGNTMAVALRKLQAYEDETGRYIPVREIGAPRNAFNFISTLRTDLNAARPGRFNGVVLSGGVHMDSMQGGNALIQFGAQLLAGFPQPQNPSAVDELSADWFNDWFAGDTDNGDELVPGSTLPISTPKGTAQGTVIGSAVPASRFVTVAV
ncbi:MAG: alpha/beta hydrolase [Mycobacterium sp.]|nr:alpha/beta hydrolase [Mycobacterium sp.]